MPKPLRIDLRLPPATGLFENAEGLVHAALYDDVCAAVDVFLNGHSTNPDGLVLSRSAHPHQVIFVDGEPGSGKSTFLLNVRQKLARNERLHVLAKNLDPNRWPNGDDTPSTKRTAIEFLLELTAIVARDVSESSKSRASADDSFRNAFEALTAALEAHLLMSSRKDESANSGAAQLRMRQVNLDLPQQFAAFLEEASAVLRCRAIVLCIDDVDLAPKSPMGLMEMLRLFAASPHLVVIWTSHKARIEQALREDGEPPDRRSPSVVQRLPRVDQEQYWRKLIHSFAEFKIDSLETALGRRSVVLITDRGDDHDHLFLEGFRCLEETWGETIPWDMGLKLRDWLNLLFTTRDWWSNRTQWVAPVRLPEPDSGLAHQVWSLGWYQSHIDRYPKLWQKAFWSMVAALQISQRFELTQAPVAMDSQPGLLSWLTRFVNPAEVSNKQQFSERYRLAMLAASLCDDFDIHDVAPFLDQLLDPHGETARHPEWHPHPWPEIGTTIRFAFRPDLDQLKTALASIEAWRTQNAEKTVDRLNPLGRLLRGLHARDRTKYESNPPTDREILRDCLGDFDLLQHPLTPEKPKEQQLSADMHWSSVLQLVLSTFSLTDAPTFKIRLEELLGIVKADPPLSPDRRVKLQNRLLEVNGLGIIAKYCKPRTRNAALQLPSTQLKWLAGLAALEFEPKRGFTRSDDGSSGVN